MLNTYEKSKIIKFFINFFIPPFLMKQHVCRNCSKKYVVRLNHYLYMMWSPSPLGKDLLVCNECGVDQLKKSLAYVKNKYERLKREGIIKE